MGPQGEPAAPPVVPATSQDSSPEVPPDVVDAIIRLYTASHGEPPDPETLRRLIAEVQLELFAASVGSRAPRRPWFGRARIRGVDRIQHSLESVGLPVGLMTESEVSSFRAYSGLLANRLLSEREDFSEFHAQRLGTEIAVTLADATLSSTSERAAIMARFKEAHPPR